MEQLGRELKSALEAGDFETARPLIESYGKTAAQALIAARGSAQREEIMKRTAAFLQDRLHLARVMRAQLATQLAAAAGLACYAERPAAESAWSTTDG